MVGTRGMGGVMIAAYWALSGIIGLYLAQALGNLGSSTRFHKEFLNY
jgi:hypothetical protein